MVSLSAKQKQLLTTWMGAGTNKRFAPLYRMSVDGCNATIFHQKCDGQGPTVTVAHNSSGYVYGGYTSQSWASDGANKTDPKAFLFSLETSTPPTKYPVKSGGVGAIYGSPNNGPTFGQHDIMFFSGSIARKGNVYNLNMTANFGTTYTTNGDDFNNLAGGIKSVTELVVYCVTDYEEIETWRKTPVWDAESMIQFLLDNQFLDMLMTAVGTYKPFEGLTVQPSQPTTAIWGFNWPFQFVASLKDWFESYRPYQGQKPRHVQILLLGPVGSGKSSFYNTISSIFRGRISSQAPTGSVEHSLTSQYRKYKVLVGGAAKATRFRLCDSMGLEEGQGIDSADIPFLLDGNVPDRYRFNPASHVTSDIPYFNKTPDLKEKIHCAAFVLDSTKVDTMSDKMMLKIQSIRQHVNQRSIPIVVLLTKVDKLCPLVFEDVSATFRSADVRDMVDRTADLVGVPRSHVLPLKNYESEIELDPNINTLALLALRQMLWFADDFLCNETEECEQEGS